MGPDRNDLIYIIGELHIKNRMMSSELRMAHERIRELGGEVPHNGDHPHPHVRHEEEVEEPV